MRGSQIPPPCFISQLVTVRPYVAIHTTDTFLFQKKSIDVSQKACGVCHGRLEFLGKFNADGTQCEERPATAFSLFVKTHFGAVKERLPAGTPHKLLMKELSNQWKSGGTGKKKPSDGADGNRDALGEGMRTLKL